jgi:hypothetical protein
MQKSIALMTHHRPYTEDTEGVFKMRENFPQQEKPGPESGFLLMEVMIAIAIFGIGIFAVAVMQSGAQKGDLTSRSVSEASVIASDHLERLMSLPRWENLAENPANPYCHEYLKDTNKDGKVGLGNVGPGTSDHVLHEGKYTVYWNIATGVFDADPNTPNTKTAAVIVAWGEGKQPHRVIMEGVIVRR